MIQSLMMLFMRWKHPIVPLMSLCMIQMEEAEDLPGMQQEEEDAVAAEEEHNDTEFDDAVDEVETSNSTTGEPVHDPNGRMPGQLPTEAMESYKDYHAVK